MLEIMYSSLSLILKESTVVEVMVAKIRAGLRRIAKCFVRRKVIMVDADAICFDPPQAAADLLEHGLSSDPRDSLKVQRFRALRDEMQKEVRHGAGNTSVRRGKILRLVLHPRFGVGLYWASQADPHNGSITFDTVYFSPGFFEDCSFLLEEPIELEWDGSGRRDYERFRAISEKLRMSSPYYWRLLL